MNDLMNSVRNAVKYWWVSLLIGIFAIVVGILCMTTPDATLVALTYLFVAMFFIDGIFEIIFAVSNRESLSQWGWNLAMGILEIVLGIVLLALPWPFVTVMLIYMIGFWIMFRSFWTFGEAFELKRIGVRSWGWLLALAILSILFSFVFFLSPLFSGVFIVAFVSVAFIAYGIFRIYMGIQLRSIHKEL